MRPNDLLAYFDEKSAEFLNASLQFLSPGVPLSDLAASLIDLGHEVTILTSTGYVIDTHILTGKNLTIVILPRTKPARLRTLIFHLPELFRSYRFLKSQEFDVIHSHWSNEITLAALFFNRNTLVTFHDNPWRIFVRNRKISNLVRTAIFVVILMLSRNRVVVSESLRSEFPFKFWSKSFTCIPNAVNLPALHNSPPNLKAKKSQRKFLMVSGEERYKNRSVLLQSLSLLSNVERIEVAIISSSDSIYEELISDKVKLRLTGPLSRSQIVAELSQAHCIVHLSEIESFSLVTAEARVLAVPMIVGKQSIAVIQTAGPSAFQVDAKSKHDVATAISKFANDPNLANDCRDSTLFFGDNLFSNDNLLKSYLSLYQGKSE
jgi:glycosyltransferase involved in cell wall biosynthesis